MIPIFEQGKGQGIGHTLDTFLNRFLEICEEHIKNKRAKSFAFILYDFHDNILKDTLRDNAVFTHLDRLSGSELSIFFLNAEDQYVYSDFNNLFLGAFEIDNSYNLPCVLLFNVRNDDVTDLNIIELQSSNIITSFHELYQILEQQINLNKKSDYVATKKSSNFLKVIIKTGDIAYSKIIEYLTENGIEVFSKYFKNS